MKYCNNCLGRGFCIDRFTKNNVPCFACIGTGLSPNELKETAGDVSDLSVDEQLALLVVGRPFIADEFVGMYMAMIYGRNLADETTIRPELLKGTLRIRPVNSGDVALVRNIEEMYQATAVIELTALGHRALRDLEENA